jgi:hypothetical protein
MKLYLVTAVLLGSLTLADARTGGGSGATAAKPAVTPATATATATKLTELKAKQLLLGLKLAGVPSAKVKQKWTFAAKSIACHAMAENDDALGTYDCQIDAKKITGAAAFVLSEALVAAGAPEDSGMSQTHVNVHALSCVDDQDAHGDHALTYSCQFESGS